MIWLKFICSSICNAWLRQVRPVIRDFFTVIGLFFNRSVLRLTISPEAPLPSVRTQSAGGRAAMPVAQWRSVRRRAGRQFWILTPVLRRRSSRPSARCFRTRRSGSFVCFPALPGMRTCIFKEKRGTETGRRSGILYQSRAAFPTWKTLRLPVMTLGRPSFAAFDKTRPGPRPAARRAAPWPGRPATPRSCPRARRGGTPSG